ncbi:hypothetical protein K9N50_10945 [bacterium]|nr:hypothetical protein [bacterium]
MSLKCKCGSELFRPIGIQEGLPEDDSDDNPSCLFLVNCLICGTTIACNRFDYALMQATEAEEALSIPFYSTV